MAFDEIKAPKLLIDGNFVEGGGNSFDLIDKYRLTPIASIRLPDTAQVVATVQAAHAAFRSGPPGPADRGNMLDCAADLVAQSSEELTRLIQIDSGFPATDAKGEVTRCIETLRLSAVEARTLAGDVLPLDGAPDQVGRFGFTLRVPLGVVAAITPFNSPLNTLMHKVAPALAAGNAVIVKPSSSTPLTAHRIVEILKEAGVPRGFVSLLYGEAEEVRKMLDQPEIRYVAFTGSTQVGRILQQQAGLRRTQMELSSIAFTILCSDADIDRALPKIVSAAYRKAGQVCTSTQILLVHATIIATVTERLTAMVKALRYGDPMLPETIIGPVINEGSAIRIEQWIEQAIAGGATRHAGGARQGSIVPPTLLTGVDRAMKIGCDEVFGPVLSIERFETLGQAFDRVNSTPYGLASGIFTNRIDDAFKAARQLTVGTVHVNEASSSRVDMMPFGGSKNSGFGREGPRYAVREMTEERTITFSGLK